MPSVKTAREASGIAGLTAALDSQTARLGPFHPQTIRVANKLAIAFWSAGNINRAIGLLDQALDGLACSVDRDHPVRTDLLSTLGEIMVQQAHLEQAALIYREVLDLSIRHSGENHPSALAAKGDLAAVLFELDLEEEATRLETQACEGARIHLGKTHPVSCVLAWNRATTTGDRRVLPRPSL